MKLPRFDLPKPTMWDWGAVGILVLGAVLMGANLLASQHHSSVPGILTALFVSAQMVICLGSLLMLGKTAKQGTLWGNLGAVLGAFVGMSGILLAAALWTVG